MVVLETERQNGTSRHGPVPEVDSEYSLQRAAVRVRDLGASIRFYHDFFNLQLVQSLDVPGASIQRAIVAKDLDGFCLELVSDGTTPDFTVGTSFGHFSLAVDSIDSVVQALRDAGHGDLVINEEAAVIAVAGIQADGIKGTVQDRVAVVKDLSGWTWELVEMHGSVVSEPLLKVMLHVRNLRRTLAYMNALGMNVLHTYEAGTRRGAGHAAALVGYGPELKSTLLEMRQDRDASGRPAKHTPGDGFLHLVTSCPDLEEEARTLKKGGIIFERADLPAVDDPTQTVPALCVAEFDERWPVIYFVEGRGGTLS